MFLLQNPLPLAAAPLFAVKDIASFVGGGLVGVLINQFYSRRQARTEVSLKLIDHYFEMYGDLEAANTYLAGPLPVPLPELTQEEAKALNIVRKVADWFDTVGRLYGSGYANRRLLDEVGIGDLMIQFRRQLENHPRNCNAHTQWRNLFAYPGKPD
jgi:hypothetical protein